MQSAVVLKTDKNHYFYDRKSKYLVPVDKLFYNIFDFVIKNKYDNIFQIYKNDYSMQEIEECIAKIQNYISLGLVVETTDLEINPLRVCSVELAQLLHQRCSQLVLQVTERCQLDCTYCSYGSIYNEKNNERSKDMEWSIALHALDDRIKAWSSLTGESRSKQFFISFYGGEPLLNFDLIEKAVAYIKKKMPTDINYAFSMTTNALLLKRYSAFLHEHNFHLLISLDGDREAHSFRVFKNGKSSFDEVVENIDFVFANYPEFFKRNVFFNTVVTTKTDLDSLITFIDKRYSKFTHFSGVNPDNVIDMDCFQALNVNLQNEIMQTIKATNDKNVKNQLISLQQFGIGDFLRGYTNYCCSNCFKINSEKKGQYINNGTCLPFYKKIYVDIHGKVLPCERVSAPFPLGEISNHGVEIDFSILVEKYNSAQVKNSELCKSCFEAITCTFCHYSCFEGKCKNFADKDAFIKRLEYKLMQAELFLSININNEELSHV